MAIVRVHESAWRRKDGRKWRWKCTLTLPVSISLCPPGLALQLSVNVTDEPDDKEVEMVGQPRWPDDGER